jgi:hypothetical protein
LNKNLILKNGWGIKKWFLPTLIMIFVFIGLVIGIHHFTKEQTLGFDFYLYWNSTRSFIFEGLNPYSEEVAVQNQIGFFGFADSKTLGLSYFRNPIYSILPIIPLSLLDYHWAQSIWTVLNIIMILICFYYAFPDLPKWMLILFVFFYQISFGLIEGNFSLLAGLIILLAIGIIFLQGKRDIRTQIIIGSLLTISTFKPQLSWFFLFWILLFAFKQRLFPFIISFFGTLSAVSLVMLFFFPTWPKDFIQMILTYQQGIGLVSTRIAILQPPLDDITATFIGNLLLVAFLCITILLIFRRNDPTKSDKIIQLAFISITTFLAHPSGFSTEQISLLIPVIIWLSYSDDSSIIKTITWLTMFIFSYLCFWGSQVMELPRVIIKGPILISLIWIGLLIYLYMNSKNRKEVGA